MITVSKVYDACKNGNVQFLQDFLNSDLYKSSNEVSTNQMLMLGCMKNQLDIVKCILASHEARKGLDILKEVRELVKITCQQGNFELTKYLLEQPELKDENADSEAPLMAALYCCSLGHLDILKYIVDSFPDEPLISRGLQNGNLLVAACEDGHIEVVKYLLESSQLQINFELEGNQYKLFTSAYDNSQFEVLSYFIVDLDLKKTDSIKEHMAKTFKPEVDNIFNMRDLNKSLKEELNDNQPHNKKLKV